MQSEPNARLIDPSSSPRKLGFRMPAEWERHESTWISWPHNEETWPDELVAVERTVAKAVRVLARSERVRINVNSNEHEKRARLALDEAGVSGSVLFHRIPTNDAWVRDYGPTFVRSEAHGLAAVCWRFNSWGEKYPPYDLDAGAPARMAGDLGVPTFQADMILEGGSIDVNGGGLLLTTESCLLHPNRNPHLTHEDVEQYLQEYLGVDHVIWLKEGIVGDDTDGHIDDLSRFIDARRVVTAVENDTASENHSILQENLDRLERVVLPDGSALAVTPLPMPSPRRLKGETMPASYANFYIGNRTVLVPTYDDANDAEAIATLQRAFPDRRVTGLYCGDLIWGLGAFHCLTQQVPAPIGHDGRYEADMRR